MASEQEEKKTVVLKSNDGQTFEVAKEAASLSETISQTIEDDVGDEVPLPLVSGNILAKIIEYCNKHTESDTATKGKEKADGDDAGKIISSSKKNPLKDWDKEYINMDIDQLFELVKAANYLNIKDLLDLTCQAIADYIQDKSVEEVRKIFNIENDFTPEEEEAIRNEHAWAFE